MNYYIFIRNKSFRIHNTAFEWSAYEMYDATGVVDPDLDTHESALILVGWMRIQEGKNAPQKCEDIPCFEVLYVLI
jgi:hypothetical protein